MTTPDTAASVHWTQDGLEALVEGKDGHGDTCGPIAMLAYRHVAHNVALLEGTLDASRNELIAWGLMDTPGEPGMTVAAMATALRDHYSSPPVKVVDFNAGLNLDAFHADLKAAMLAHQAVIMETSDAAALPGNQPSVHYHFVLLWGIDSTDGYWCANGDLESGIQGSAPTIAPVWVTWEHLAASQPCGYLILPAVAAPAPPPPEPEVVITEAPGAPQPVVRLAGNRWEITIPQPK